MGKLRRSMTALDATARGSLPVLRMRRYQTLVFVLSFVLFGLYIFVPIWFVPGNSLAFTLSLMRPENYLLLTALALMTSVLFAFELYAFRRSHAIGLRVAGEGGAGFFASIAGGVLAAASCGCGIGILLGFVGLGGGALFVVAHQTAIIALMLGIVAVGLYFSARRAAGICATCAVPIEHT